MGAFWDVVAESHRIGGRGQAVRVAVLDSGFDAGRRELVGATLGAETASDRGPNSHHGTAVAALVATVAPDAELLLIDVSLGTSPDKGRVAAAFDEVEAAGCQVVCASFGFLTDAVSAFPRDGVDPAVLSDLSADPLAITATAEAWARAGFHHFVAGGCTSRCEVCDRLDQVGQVAGSAPVIVAAAGNDDTIAKCPGVHAATISAAFQHSTVVSGPDGVVRDSHAMVSEQFVRHDLTLQRIPVAPGTSFAAPLLAGLAALAGPQDFVSAVGVRSVLDLALCRHHALDRLSGRTVGGAPADDEAVTVAIAGLEAAYAAVNRRLPHASHTESCSLCGFLLEGYWRSYGLFLLNTQRAEDADVVLAEGLRVAPWHPGLWANAAAVRRELADYPAARRMYTEAVRLARAPVERRQYLAEIAALPA